MTITDDDIGNLALDVHNTFEDDGPFSYFEIAFRKGYRACEERMKEEDFKFEQTKKKLIEGLEQVRINIKTMIDYFHYFKR